MALFPIELSHRQAALDAATHPTLQGSQQLGTYPTSLAVPPEPRKRRFTTRQESTNHRQRNGEARRKFFIQIRHSGKAYSGERSPTAAQATS